MELYLKLSELALACPRCAAGVIARREVLEQTRVEHVLLALVPFVIIAGLSYGASRMSFGGDG